VLNPPLDLRFKWIERRGPLPCLALPNYQRWEAGSAPIPEAKLKKLAKVLKTSPEAILLDRHPPIETSIYDDSVSDKLSYYGEVSIHFCGGGASLLLSISEEAFTHLHRDLQGDLPFVTVESLANQTVAIELCWILGDEAIRRRGLPALG
jgi:hypothetical protein